ncbi:hypothetical protein [Streptomyces axinellae]|uniref:Glycosyltransferase RgtA/B/C/D-like domain-containing protein n=1 Tax=Streptomyces axinellae TaxID=552788 RepID=A0ABN3Q3G3_9ACTN
MATTSPTTIQPVRPAARTRPDNRQKAPRRIPWLSLVAVAYAITQLLLVVGRFGPGWDETVYISQLDPHRPAAFFSAPRSRGISLLVAPVTAVTDSTTGLRIALTLLSALGLYAAFRVWQPLLGRCTSALAALLFSTLWVAVLYGPQAMPNLWVALTAVAALGWFLRAAGPDAPHRAYVLLAGSIAAATLFRFSDGIWLTLALPAACLLVRARHRPRLLLAVLGGLVLGSAQWAAEAYSRFGGIGTRLHLSSTTEGGMHLHWNGSTARNALDGPLLCRPCTIQPGPTTHALWWFALPTLALIACAVAVRVRRPATALPVAGAAALSAPYLLLIDYFAPRFLLPAYALLALPVAALTVRAIGAVRPGTPRLLTGAALTALLAAQLSTQYQDLHRNIASARATAARYATTAEGLRHLGVHAPCLITGEHAPPIGFYTGCASANVSGNNRNTTPAAIRRAAAREPTAVLTRKHHAPFYARGWTAHPLRDSALIAYLPPHQ